MPEAPFTLEYYQTPEGDEPIRRWLWELDPGKRRAVVTALECVLRRYGIDVCHTEFGRHLGDGLFEFRLRFDEAAARARLHLVTPIPPGTGRAAPVLLRVFCHAYGRRVVLLVAAHDEDAGPGRLQRQREARIARDRLTDFRARLEGRPGPEPAAIQARSWRHCQSMGFIPYSRLRLRR